MALLRRITLIAMSVAALTFGLVPLLSSPSYAGSVAAAPTLISPANDPNTAVKDLVLRWHAVSGADQYQVEMSRNIDFTNGEVGLPGNGLTTATVFEVPLGLPHASYFWKVRAIVNGTPGHWSEAWQFLREWESLIHITQTPSSTDPTVSWAPVPDASEYRVIFATSPITPDALLNGTGGCLTHNTSFTPGWGGIVGVRAGDSVSCQDPVLVDKTTYYWGVAAFDDTTTAELTVDGLPTLGCGTKLPECDASYVNGGSFTYTAPTGGAIQQLTGLATTWRGNGSATPNVCDSTTPCPMTPTFSWTPVQGADIYFTTVYLDRDATSVYREYVSQTSTFTPPDQFADAQTGKPYYWQVQAATCGGQGVQCTPPAAATQGCPPPSSSGSSSSAAKPATAARPAATPSPTTTATPTVPTITAMSVSPDGPEGNQSMQGGTTGTITLTGTNFQSGACASASSGVITSVPSVSAGSMSFKFWAPVDGGSVTFQVENPDGTISDPSPALSVDSSAQNVALSAISSFQKRSGPVTLRSPADGAITRGSTVTFSWDDYIASGSQGSYDPKNYEIQVSTDPDFGTTLIDQNDIDLTQYTPTTNILTDGHYYWRVNAIDQTGDVLTWSSTRQLTINASGPTATLGGGGRGVTKPLKIDFSVPVTHVNSRNVLVVPDGKSASSAVPGKITLGSTPTRYVFTPTGTFATGGSYDLVVRSAVVDSNGNSVIVTGPPVRVTKLATNRSKGWTYSNGWKRQTASGAASGSYMQAGAGRTAQLRVAGTKAQLLGCMGPTMGSLSITIHGTTQTVSEHQSFTRCGVVVWHHALPSGESTLKVSVSSGHGNIDEVKVT
ncbi:MAG: hypothetical protein ACTHK4_11350 [Mycobacteriales bacterium]